jgi:hypothetical protein
MPTRDCNSRCAAYATSPRVEGFGGFEEDIHDLKERGSFSLPFIKTNLQINIIYIRKHGAVTVVSKNGLRPE